ncbi:PKD domain-containing protein [Streptomyces sp. NPDC048278]|uniref:PKD domain-containing protein n=1 Tax=Streptomyces sp. NPDC048278 TaxID=3155809 RepID=UPI00342F16B2
MTQDKDFREPYVDTDEWRDLPVRHRYVHGGFANNDTRFSFYFPPADQYQGRFFQHITPVPGSENLAQTARGQEDKIGFAVSSGAYFVETNGGGEAGGPGSAADPTIGAYRANAAAAQYSRVVAQEMYGGDRPFGYAYGGSGGGFRTIGGAENTQGVWDGCVPYVIASPMAMPSVFSVRMHAQRVLRDQLDRIVDALEPGGSGNPFDGLDEEESTALTEVTRMGFPPRSWFAHPTMGMHGFSALYAGLVQIDPGYFEDFWTQPGYLGADPTSSVHRDRARYRCEVLATITRREAVALGLEPRQPEDLQGGVDHAFKARADDDTVFAVRLSTPPPCTVQGAVLTVHTGIEAGATFILRGIEGDLALLDRQHTPQGLRAGDEIEIDNSNFLAAQTYHRHQVPPSGFPAWDQFRAEDGTPLYPQRPFLAGPIFTRGASGTLQSGKISGKMIVVACLLDREAFPWQADWYRSKVREHLGDGTDDQFRLWYVDNAEHGDEQVPGDSTHVVSYVGVLHKALRDVSAWAEKGTPPIASSTYTVEDSQVRVPASAHDRGGVQPVARLTADGADQANLQAGKRVTLRLDAEIPPNAGKIVSVAWDFDGDGTFPVTETTEPSERIRIERQHTFSRSGTHFVTVRVSAQHEGDPTTVFARIDNIARVRVVVGI